MKQKKLIVGAWKLFVKKDHAVKLSALLADWSLNKSKRKNDFEIILSPPSTYLMVVHEKILGTEIRLSAQDVDPVGMGAYTGHVSPEILKDVGCEYVIVGHSELRQGKGQTLFEIHDKVDTALKNGLKVILCIGETMEERNSKKTETILKEQIETALKNINESNIKDDFNIAYEPIWAISSQNSVKPPKPEEVKKTHIFIKKTLNELLDAEIVDKIKILYGGSVNAKNVCDYLNEPLIEGVLVGRASTEFADFCALLEAVEDQVIISA